MFNEGKELSATQNPGMWIAWQGEAHKLGLQVRLLPEGLHYAHRTCGTQVYMTLNVNFLVPTFIESINNCTIE